MCKSSQLIKAKNYTQSVAEANKTMPKRNEHALLEIPIICGRNASSFSLRPGMGILINIILVPCTQHS